MADEAALEVRNVKKRFGSVEAVRGVSLEVKKGEVFALLGPNGAGKTTLIKMILGLFPPTEGEILVMGKNPRIHRDEVRRMVGWVPQELTIDRLLTGRENLMLQAGIYHLPGPLARRRVEEVLQLVGLEGAAHRPAYTYSGGMRKRLDLAMGLIHRPPLLLLDEPTLGLDIYTRRNLWDTIRAIQREGTTILLTTHYLEEADALCQRVAILHQGKLQALDTPEALKRQFGQETIRLEVQPSTPEDEREALQRLAHALGKRQGFSLIQPRDNHLFLAVSSHAEAVPQVLEVAREEGVELAAIVCLRPSLDDVFVELTGKSLRGGERAS